MQETEINKNLDHNLLSFPGFSIETENKSTLSRVAIYIDNRVDYVRRKNLEGLDSYVMILDLVGRNKVRIISVVYRSFAPQNGVTQRDKFNQQLQIVRQSFTQSTILLGDFIFISHKKNPIFKFSIQAFSHATYDL